MFQTLVKSNYNIIKKMQLVTASCNKIEVELKDTAGNCIANGI